MNERRGRLTKRVLLALLGICFMLPALRVAGVIDWRWGLALAPFTIGGFIFGSLMIPVLLGPQLEWVRRLITAAQDGTPPLTPTPAQLDQPLAAEAAGEAILVQHPELLAALCHGFRMLSLQPIVLGRPVTDPWGVYGAAVLASSLELEQIRIVARKHMQRNAAQGKKAMGRTPSDAQVMKRAVEQFRRCADRSIAGGVNPDCPFEHVTVIFGARSPNRDAHLRSVAPKVRALLERQYPQLATARLSDGSPVKYTEWQKEAARNRKELAQLRKDHERQLRKIAELQVELTATKAQAEALRDTVETARTEARAAGRAEHEKTAADLRTALERGRIEHARNLQRIQAETERLQATIEALSAERDALEHVLFHDDDEEEAIEPAPTTELAGMRVLLVGGDAGHVPPIREYLEARGVQLLHEDGPDAVQLVAGVHAVVLWTRFLNHPTYFAVKRECRLREVPDYYWARTSPVSLVALIAQASLHMAERGVRPS